MPRLVSLARDAQMAPLVGRIKYDSSCLREGLVFRFVPKQQPTAPCWSDGSMPPLVSDLALDYSLMRRSNGKKML